MMKNIVLRFTYDCCVIAVPEYIEKDILKIRRQFDKWLYDKSNDHGYWIYIDSKKRAVSFDSYAFIEYLNRFHVKDKSDSVCIIEEKTNNIPSSLTILDF